MSGETTPAVVTGRVVVVLAVGVPRGLLSTSSSSTSLLGLCRGVVVWESVCFSFPLSVFFFAGFPTGFEFDLGLFLDAELLLAVLDDGGISLSWVNFQRIGTLSGRDYDSREAGSILPVCSVFWCEVGAAILMGVVVAVARLVLHKFGRIGVVLGAVQGMDGGFPAKKWRAIGVHAPESAGQAAFESN